MSTPIFSTVLSPTSQSRETLSSAASAATVSARGSRSRSGESNWVSVERSSPARLASDARESPDRASAAESLARKVRATSDRASSGFLCISC